MPQQTIGFCEVLSFAPVLISDKCSLSSSASRLNNADVGVVVQPQLLLTRSFKSRESLVLAPLLLCFLALREELHTADVFFLEETYGHHSVLLQPAIQLAAIDSQRGRGTHLVATKLL